MTVERNVLRIPYFAEEQHNRETIFHALFGRDFAQPTSTNTTGIMFFSYVPN